MSNMDFVIITYGPDIKLLRHCLLSYEIYFQSKSKIFIFVSKRDSILLTRIDLPENSVLIFKDDFPELALAKSGVTEQIYLKMIAYRFVTTEYFCIIDSDFLFLRSTRKEDFFLNDKPLWFYTTWEGHEQALRWRSDSEIFLRAKIPYLFLEFPQYVFIRSVALALDQAYPVKNILSMTLPSEYLIYGAYSFKYNRDMYEFVLEGDRQTPICGKVNQIPPTYHHLDPYCSYSQFIICHYVVFWSHWELAEQKMIEFFEDSQRHNFGNVIRPADRSLLLPDIRLPFDQNRGFNEFDGVFSDGWMKQTTRFSVIVPANTRIIVLDLMVPAHPSNPKWELSAMANIDGPPAEIFHLMPGMNRLPLAVDFVTSPQTLLVTIEFGEGFRYENNADEREFRARLCSINFL